MKSRIFPLLLVLLLFLVCLINITSAEDDEVDADAPTSQKAITNDDEANDEDVDDGAATKPFEGGGADEESDGEDNTTSKESVKSDEQMLDDNTEKQEADEKIDSVERKTETEEKEAVDDVEADKEEKDEVDEKKDDEEIDQPPTEDKKAGTDEETDQPPTEEKQATTDDEKEVENNDDETSVKTAETGDSNENEEDLRDDIKQSIIKEDPSKQGDLDHNRDLNSIDQEKDQRDDESTGEGDNDNTVQNNEPTTDHQTLDEKDDKNDDGGDEQGHEQDDIPVTERQAGGGDNDDEGHEQTGENDEHPVQGQSEDLDTIRNQEDEDRDQLEEERTRDQDVGDNVGDEGNPDEQEHDQSVTQAGGGDNDGDPENAPSTERLEELEDEDGQTHDEGVKVDEDSLGKVVHEKEELVKKLHVLQLLEKRMELKNKLLKRVKSLHYEVNSTIEDHKIVEEEKLKAEENYRLSVLKKNATSDERESTAREREELEKLLKELRTEQKSFDEEYTKLTVDRQKKEEEEKRMKKKKRELMEQLDQLTRKFYFQGYHTWLKSNMDGFPLIIRETILKTGDTFNPMIEGLEGLNSMNDHLSRQAAGLIPSIRKNQFYIGLIYYIFLLVPTVSAFWLVMKVKQRLSLLTVEHYLIAINLYFAIMSAVCAILTILNGRDVLATLRQHSKFVAEPFMIIHGFLFVVHLVLHGVTAYVSGSRKDFLQYLGMSCVGLHFFTHAYKRTILNRDPNVGAPAYIVYTTVFVYVLYDRGIHIIEAVLRGRKAGLSAFGTFPADDSQVNGFASTGKGPSIPTTMSTSPRANGFTGAPTRSDTTVYFAGLPVFNGPSHSSLNDAKTI